MNKAIVSLVVVFGLIGSASAQLFPYTGDLTSYTEYIYTGQYFSNLLDFPNQPFSTSNKIVGAVIVPITLPANFSTSNASQISGISWYFSDGLRASSWNWLGGPGGGWYQPLLATDSNGDIFSWNFNVSTPYAASPSVWLQTTSWGDYGYYYDPSFFGNQYANQCASSSDIGSWTIVTVPEPSTYALLLLGAAASLWALKRRKS